MSRVRSRKESMQLRIGTALLLISLFSGCAVFGTARQEVRPLDGDFFFVKKGEVVTIAKNGAFCSDEYLSEILLVTTKEKR
jgi:hypothetical protein